MSKISRLEVIATGARRRWTVAEKRRIIAESQTGRRQISATARRHGLYASQLFTWCRLARQGRLLEDDEATTFAPVLISSAPSTNRSSPSFPECLEATVENSPSSPCSIAARGRIEIVLTCGRRMIVDNGVDSAALARVLAVLERS
jgi:transposase